MSTLHASIDIHLGVCFPVYKSKGRRSKMFPFRPHYSHVTITPRDVPDESLAAYLDSNFRCKSSSTSPRQDVYLRISFTKLGYRTSDCVTRGIYVYEVSYADDFLPAFSLLASRLPSSFQGFIPLTTDPRRSKHTTSLKTRSEQLKAKSLHLGRYLPGNITLHLSSSKESGLNNTDRMLSVQSPISQSMVHERAEWSFQSTVALMPASTECPSDMYWFRYWDGEGTSVLCVGGPYSAQQL